MSELKSKVCPATRLEITTSIGCLTVPMSTIDSKRMMTKALGFNRPLHQSHLATNELYGKMTTATLWIYNNVISFAELKFFLESILVIPMVSTDSINNYIFQLDRLKDCEFLSSKDIYRIGIELWTVGICQAAWNVAAKKKLQLLKSNLPNSKTEKNNGDIGVMDHEYIKFWGELTSKRIITVDAMSKIMKTCILNYWSSHLHHSRTRRYDMRAVIVKEVFEKIKLQYDSFNESIIQKKEKMIEIYNQEHNILNQRYDEMKNEISLLTNFYTLGIQRFGEGLGSVLKLIGTTIYKFLIVIRSNRDKSVHQTLLLTKVAHKEPAALNIWQVWPQLIAGNDDGVKLNNINNKFHSGVEATNEIVLKRFNKCVCKLNRPLF